MKKCLLQTDFDQSENANTLLLNVSDAMKWNTEHHLNKYVQADLHVTQRRIMGMSQTGKEMETDLHASRLIVIPWLSLRQTFIYMINS